jgi:anti-sigma factor RsiW
MLMRSDQTLVAYLDGELDETACQDVDSWLEADAAARDRLVALAASASLVRSAFADILNEELPERLIVAARGELAGGGESAGEAEPPEAEIIRFAPQPPKPAATAAFRRWGPMATAAALAFGIVLGGAGGYYGIPTLVGAGANPQTTTLSAATSDWLNNAAGYYKLAVAAGDNTFVDVPATGDPKEALQKISQELPQQVRLPNLKPWGLNFRGARLVVEEGRPAAQLIYTTDNKAIGPLTLIIGSSKEPDSQPTFDHRQDVNLLYWRHQGRAYVLVGQADIGYLWGIANDVAWQLDAI